MGDVTVADAARELEVSEPFVRRLIREGRLEAARVGRTYLVSEAALARYRRSGRRPGRPRLVAQDGSSLPLIAATGVAALDQRQATPFIAGLVGAEMHRLKLGDQTRRYSIEERAGDGGCDLLMEVPIGVANRYIPAGRSVWQVKSGRAPSPKTEIEGPRHEYVRNQLRDGAAYVLACVQSFTPRTQERLEADFNRAVAAINPRSPVVVLFGTNLAEWTLSHPAMLHRLGGPFAALNDWRRWERIVVADEDLPFINDEARRELVDWIRAWAGDPSDSRARLHLYGHSGVGKSGPPGIHVGDFT